jgi:hypothetical protein
MGMLVCWACSTSARIRRHRTTGSITIRVNVRMPSCSHDDGQCSGNCNRHFPDRVYAGSFANRCQLFNSDQC